MGSQLSPKAAQTKGGTPRSSHRVGPSCTPQAMASGLSATGGRPSLPAHTHTCTRKVHCGQVASARRERRCLTRSPLPPQPGACPQQRPAAQGTPPTQPTLGAGGMGRRASGKSGKPRPPSPTSTARQAVGSGGARGQFCSKTQSSFLHPPAGWPPPSPASAPGLGSGHSHCSLRSPQGKYKEI